MKWAVKLATVLLTLFTTAPWASAQVCGQWQTGIGPDGAGGGIAGTDGPINSLVTWDPDGDGPATELAVISGRFSIAGTAIVRFARDSGYLHGMATWDGERWAVFPVPPDHLQAQSLTLLGTNGTALIAAVRESQTSWHVLVFDGSEWTQFGQDFSGTQCSIKSMAVVDGEIVVGGRFSHVGTAAASSVARWDGEA